MLEIHMFSQESFVRGLIVAELTTMIVRVITMLHIHVFSQEGFVGDLIVTEVTSKSLPCLKLMCFLNKALSVAL